MRGDTAGVAGHERPTLPIDHVNNHSWIALRECGVVFILPKKTASSSVKRAIRLAIGHPKVQPDMLDYVSRGEAANFEHRIAICRNPLTRLQSCYADKFGLRKSAGREMLPDFAAVGLSYETTFRTFVRVVCEIPDDEALGDLGHFRSQVVDMVHGEYMPTILLRFEQLNEGWKLARETVRKAGGPKLPSLEHLRKSDHALAPWTEELQDMAVDRYREDFEAFGYRC